MQGDLTHVEHIERSTEGTNYRHLQTLRDCQQNSAAKGMERPGTVVEEHCGGGCGANLKYCYECYCKP